MTCARCHIQVLHHNNFMYIHVSSIEQHADSSYTHTHETHETHSHTAHTVHTQTTHTALPINPTLHHTCIHTLPCRHHHQGVATANAHSYSCAAHTPAQQGSLAPPPTSSPSPAHPTPPTPWRCLHAHAHSTHDRVRARPTCTAWRPRCIAGPTWGPRRPLGALQLPPLGSAVGGTHTAAGGPSTGRLR